MTSYYVIGTEIEGRILLKRDMATSLHTTI